MKNGEIFAQKMAEIFSLRQAMNLALPRQLPRTLLVLQLGLVKIRWSDIARQTT